MFATVPLLTLLALSVTGSPVEVHNSRITLPITGRLKFSNGTNLIQHDEARVAALRANLPLENEHVCSTVSVGIGYPPTYYNLLVDSGSAVTWVGANKEYQKTASTIVTPWEVAVTYELGFFSGTLFYDVFTFGNAFTTGMAFGVASDYDEDMVYNGILGIGPAGLSVGSVKNNPEMELKTITQRLFDTGSISQPLVGIFFRPSSRDGDENDGGTLNFGEPNRAFYTGDIAYTPVTTIPDASKFWGIKQRITYGTTEILPTVPGIVDSGCTFNFLASDAYEKYRVATGANLDARTGLLSITPEQYRVLRPLKFHIGDKTYSLTRNAQIWPRHLNYRVEGLQSGIYLAMQSLSTPIGYGEDFRIGYVFLQRFYVAFDIAGSRVGFAKTLFTDATTN